MHHYSTRKISRIFIIFFLLSFLLLGNSRFFILLVGLSTFGFLFIEQKTHIKRNHFPPVTQFFFFLFLIGQIVSSFFTHSIPLSLQSVIFFSFGYLIFEFTVSFNDFDIERQVIDSILCATTVLMFLSILSLIYKPFSELLPGMNLLYHSFGHNHFAAVLLLVIPIAWQKASIEIFKRGSHASWFLLPVVLSFYLLFTFARVGIMIGLLELVCIFFLLRRSVLKNDLIHVPKYTHIFFWIILSLFVAVIFFQLYYSVSPLFMKRSICPTDSFRNQLCKGINTELRWYYWQQAVSALRENLVFGYGPGTFELISTKYRQLAGIKTSFAHNFYLNVFAESGLIVGSIFIGLIFFMVKETVQVIKDEIKNKKKWSYNPFLFLGLVGISINSIFDFDWHFIGIFVLTFIYVGLIIRAGSNRSITSKLRSVFAVFSLLLKLFLISVSVVFFLSLMLINSGRMEIGLSIFPFFYHEKAIIEDWDSISPDLQKKLKLLYKNHSIFYFDLLSHSSESEKLAIRKKLQRIDPWQILYQSNIPHYLSQLKHEEAEEEFIKLLSLINKSMKQYDYSLNFVYVRDFSEYAWQLCKYEYNEKRDFANSARYCEISLRFDPWIMSKKRPFVYESGLTHNNNFFDFFSLPSKEKLGNNTDAYAQFLMDKAIDDIGRMNPIFPKSELKNYIQIRPWKKYYIWESISNVYFEKIQFSLESGNLKLVKMYLDHWYEAFSILHGNSRFLDDIHTRHLSEYLLLIAHDEMISNEVTLVDYYKKALQVNRDVFFNSKIWFEVNLHRIEHEEITNTYFTDFYFSYPEVEGWKQKEHGIVLQLLILNALKERDFNQMLRYVSWYQKNDFKDYETEKEIAILLHKAADLELLEKRFEPAEKSYQVLSQLMSYNYWAQQQLANYYLLVAVMNDQHFHGNAFFYSILALQKCIVKYSYSNGCEDVLRDYYLAKPDLMQFLDAREKIMNF